MIYYWRVGILYYSDAAHEHLEQHDGRPSSVFIPGKDIGEAWAALKATSLLRDTDAVCEIERWMRAEGGIKDERRLKMECRVCHVKPVANPPLMRGVDDKLENPWEPFRLRRHGPLAAPGLPTGPTNSIVVDLNKSEDPQPASSHFPGTVPPPRVEVDAGYHRTASDFGGTVPLPRLLPTGSIVRAMGSPRYMGS